MNRIIKISIFFIYALFTQVYPVVHWHAQEHHDDVEIQLSFHPPEMNMDNFDHDTHHDQTDKHEHEHENSHIDGDWEYTFQVKNTKSPITVMSFLNFELADIETQVLSKIPKHIPLKIPDQYIPLSFPSRAPPFI